MKIEVDGKSLVKTVAVLAITFSAGVLVGNLSAPHNSLSINLPSSAVAAKTGTSSVPTAPASQDGQSNAQGSAEQQWYGLKPADANWVNQILKATAQDASGHDVSLSQDKPIFIGAYWCPYCHQTLSLLSQNNLTSKVQVLAVAFEGGEGKYAPQDVKTIDKARTLFTGAMNDDHINLSGTSVVYGLPHSLVDQVAGQNGFPTVLIKHDGTWYMAAGYNPSADFWKTILS